MSIIKNLIAYAYSIRMKISKITGMGIHILKNKNYIAAPANFYSLEATTNTGEEIKFEKYCSFVGSFFN